MLLGLCTKCVDAPPDSPSWPWKRYGLSSYSVLSALLGMAFLLTLYCLHYLVWPFFLLFTVCITWYGLSSYSLLSALLGMAFLLTLYCLHYFYFTVKFIAVVSLHVIFVMFSSLSWPWYNHNGWLGTKNTKLLITARWFFSLRQWSCLVFVILELLLLAQCLSL